MAARRANQVLATLGLFAVLVTARVAVEAFPTAQAEQAISALLDSAEPKAPSRGTAAKPAPPAPSAVPEAPDLRPTGALAESPTTERRMPTRAGHTQPRGSSLRVIRVPGLDS